MSRETVYALRRFTEKLANSPTMGGVMRSEDLVRQDGGLGFAPQKSQMPKVDATNFNQFPGLPLANITPVPATTGASATGKPMSGADFNSPMVDPEKQKPISDKAMSVVNSAGGVERDWTDYLGQLAGNIDWSMLGGAGLGGLGAYGLARLLQSRDDEERGRFPWLATLLGAGAGGLLAPHIMGNPYVQSAASGVKDMASSGYNAVTGGGQKA